MSKTISGTQTYTSQYTLTNPDYSPLYVNAGASLTNPAGPALLDLLAPGGTIWNAGFISATGTTGVGIAASGDASLINAVGGFIGGYGFAVSIAGTGLVENQGSIATRQTAGSAASFSTLAHEPIPLSAGVAIGGGAIVNDANATITSPLIGVAIGGSGSLVNAGTILNTNTSATGYGVLLQAGGSVTNQSGGLISGGHFAIADQGPLFLTNEAGGTISSPSFGVVSLYRASSIANFGTIVGNSGAGVYLGAGGAIFNGGSGKIAGGHAGVYISGQPGTVANEGLITNFYYVSNPGSSAGQTLALEGVSLSAGGTVTNFASGAILGNSYGVRITGANGTVTNGGTIISYRAMGGAGLQLDTGGTVTNTGLIAGEWIGLQLGHFNTSTAGAQGALGSVSLVNEGNIIAADGHGDGAAVWMYGPGTIINAKTGVIGGATHGVIVGDGAFNGFANGGFGIVAYYQTTVVNYGSIGGVTYNAAAYNFGTKGPKQFAFEAANHTAGNTIANLIKIAPGSSFGGVVKGSDGVALSTLELMSGASAGSVTGFGTVAVSGAYYSGYRGFGTVIVDSGANWSLGGTVEAGTSIQFTPGGGESLTIVSPAQLNGTIAGFTEGDTLALAGVTSTANTPVVLDESNRLVVVGTDLVVQFDASATGTMFAETNSGGETTITALCFLPDTLIQTPAGQVKVQELTTGDLVTTAGGTARPITWIGTGQVLATRGRRGPATPVIVRKGALGPNVPTHDLRVTKGHSLYLDGVLIPVEFLVNHRSIVWDDLAQEVRLCHVELETHDVLLANGAPAESYRDDGNRWLFQNANSGWNQSAKAPCAPVLTGGPIVDAVWRRLLDRAGPRPGWSLTDDPDLCLVVDGVRIDATARSGERWVFSLPERPAQVRVASRASAPQELGLARDPRELGVALRRIEVRQGTRCLVLDAGDERLTEGFHGYEAELGLRWTDGDALLPAGLFEDFDGPMEVELTIAGSTRYIADHVSAAA